MHTTLTSLPSFFIVCPFKFSYENVHQHATRQAPSTYKRVSCVARGRKGQRVTVTGVSAALRLVSTLVSTVAWPFQCALIEPFLFVAQCQAAGFRAARPRPAGPLLGKPPRLPRLLGGLLGILGILSRKAIGGGGTQVTSRRHTVLEPGVG